MNIKFLTPHARPAFACTDKLYQYSDIFEKISVYEKYFDGLSLERLAIFAENSPSWVFALYGAWSAKSAVIPIDAKSSIDEAAFILSDSEPQVLCCDSTTLETAKAAVAKLTNQPKIITFEEINAQKNVANASITEVERDSEELALIVYTSGTTGTPKGVMLTFANLYANIKAVIEAGYFYDGMSVLAMLPFHHILPLMGTLIAPLFVGGKMVFPKTISPADISEILQKYSVDMIVTVPRFFELVHANIMTRINRSTILKGLLALARLVNNKRFSGKLFGAIHKKFGGQVKHWICGGAALDKKMWGDLDALGFAIHEGYGMTECAPIITFPRIGRVKLGSPGEALPGIEIKIIDGEIAVRGANVTKGYYKRPEETAETIRDGWLFTGDLGHLDEEGYLYITGRRKEIIVLPNGKNVNPAEIEAQICALSHEEILEAGVMIREGVMHAIIRVQHELFDKFDAEALEEHIRNTIILPYNRTTATYRRIIRFTLTSDELPRTRVGKLKRHLLDDFINSLSDKKNEPEVPEPESKTYIDLKEILAGQIAMPPRADAHMEMDLGLDSLGKISIQCYVKENYGVEISERDFETCATLRKFAEYVEKNRNTSFEPQTKGITWSNIINSAPFPKLEKPHFFHFATIMLFRGLMRTFYRVHYSGMENLQSDKPLIIAPNHQSYIDGLLATGTFSKTQIYKTYFFAKLRSIIKKGFIRSFAERSNVVIMDINDNVSESIRKLAQALRENNRIVIFPEGTRTKDGNVSEFRQTFAILAKEMDVGVIPVAIRGAYEALKPGSTFPKCNANIFVTYLPEMKALPDESYEDFCARVRVAVETEWEKLGMMLTK